jgi:general secretion pathway protein I
MHAKPAVASRKNQHTQRLGGTFAAGFTLVEVMIALVIVATALPALVMLVSAQVNGAAHVREKTYAMWVAENELTRINMLNNKTYFPSYKMDEKDSGSLAMMGLQWQWQTEVTPEEAFPGLMKVVVGVELKGLDEGSGYSGAKGLAKFNPVATLIGYISE